MVIKNVTELVKLIENTLGWDPRIGNRIPRRVYSTYASIMNKQIAKNPSLYTLRNLELTVAWMWKKRMTVKGPGGIFLFVAEAIEDANDEQPETPIGDAVQKAMAWELEHRLPDYEFWVGVLVRAFGGYRELTLKDWAAARGQTL